MKAILASFHPEYCQLIASRKKSVELRKTKPKLDVPFKVYIYCTKGGINLYKQMVSGSVYTSPVEITNSYLTPINIKLNGKVIGEFICDRIYIINKDSIDWFYDDGFETIYFKDAKIIMGLDACLSDKQLKDYFSRFVGYGWHISDLVIYDKPKELREFVTVDREAINKCKHRERVYQNPDYVNGAWLFGGYVCNKSEMDWCCNCKRKPLKRPPQSWCYVEDGVVMA